MRSRIVRRVHDGLAEGTEIPLVVTLANLQPIFRFLHNRSSRRRCGFSEERGGREPADHSLSMDAISGCQPSSGLQAQQPPVVPGFRQTAAPPPMERHQDTHSESLQQAGDEGQAGFTQATASAGRSTRAMATRARANRNIPIFFDDTPFESARRTVGDSTL